MSGWVRVPASAEPGSVCVSSHLFVEISAYPMAVTSTAHWLEWLDIASPLLLEPLRIKNGLA